MTDPAVTVVVLAFGSEPLLVRAVDAVLSSTGVTVQIVLVDNGCTSEAVTTVRNAHPNDVRVLTPPANLGFAGGVDLGADEATAPFLALVNSDAVVEPGALRALVDALADPRVGVVSGLVLLAGENNVVNTVGNPLHVLGLSWAGHLGEPASAHRTGTRVASASGALLAIRTDLWRRLGGFPPDFFAYQEDLELSWRTWQRGLEVRYVPEAVCSHHYEFSRSPQKMYLVDRNRLLFLLTCHQARTLALLALPAAAFDLALLLVAARQGWATQWCRARVWVLGHARWIATRRRDVQIGRTVADAALAHLLTDTFDPVALPLPAGSAVIQAVFRGYWRAVRPLLPRQIADAPRRLQAGARD